MILSGVGEDPVRDPRAFEADLRAGGTPGPREDRLQLPEGDSDFLRDLPRPECGFPGPPSDDDARAIPSSAP